MVGRCRWGEAEVIPIGGLASGRQTGPARESSTVSNVRSAGYVKTDWASIDNVTD